ncbi:LEAF RUST 10 DISEASE-RESISTANCE LOCUS RECEPTOR-LIKE PROTEIN KINASE-like 1.2 [Beta vulgaris subsp. vulgaris]|uniref:LEAF RUST 10 DISEASE-RESISTANCE LOCUS RECEPTOR-LIKE PROTEIN KINASE-like 1.2 n=1 Tax=Beta vulgaris subsp. vulgaris TaxID=3555 RepID=UPI000901AD51|nr:LEAF RUST 10 DISEASE-RESISTANCE LOCUS RECEPTOR-LIKE PROTEIN KINASE-like 1.2 [Beta vulgaris subsp. vulgaris]
MHLNLLRSPLPLLSIIFILLCNNVDPSPSSPHQYLDPKYEACILNSSTCGKSELKIFYPFWGNGRPEYCGHPAFKISCDEKNLKINIMSRTYLIIDINYNTSSFKLVQEELSQGQCPGPGPGSLDLHNTTLDLALFNYTSTVKNATLFYDCAESKLLESAPFSFSCADRYPDRLSVFVITENWVHYLDEICKVKLYAPVFENALEGLYDHSLTVDDVLKRGFEIKWVIDQGHCQDCYVSGGYYCGYNITLGQSTCFCKSGSYPTVCPHFPTDQAPNKGLTLEAKVGIGIGAAAGCLFITITLFVFVRSKKDYHSSSFLPSQKISQLSTSVEEKSSYFGAQLFSYEELQQATNSFEFSKELGKGGFGTVYYGKLQDGREVAIKRLYEKHSKQVAQFMNELEILTRLDHHHLVKLYGCTTRRSRELLLVYEYVPNGTVADHLHVKQPESRPLPWPVRLRIAIETASALAYLHASDVIHRDVKTKNILLDANYSVKVADFGLSRLFPLDVSHISTTPQGSPGYVDPEYHQCYQLTNKSDVYSFGVVLAELISGKSAVDRNRSRHEINLSSMATDRILKRAWTEFVDPKLAFELDCKVREEVVAVADLTFRCLEATSDSRPSMDEVLECLRNVKGEGSIDDDDDEIIDMSKDAAAVFNGCESLTSSNGSGIYDSNKIHKDESAAHASSTNSQISVLVNVSSETV